MPSSSRPYSIVEPHPSFPSNTYLHTGRGGAGNLHHLPTSVTRGSDASGPPSSITTTSTSTSSSSKSFHTGRGGAGNYHHPPSERAIFSFDEELERQMSRDRHAAPVYHVGRGGAGNVSKQDKLPAAYPGGVNVRRKSNDSDGASRRSASSAESGADVATKKLRDGWRKITGMDLKS